VVKVFLDFICECKEVNIIFCILGIISAENKSANKSVGKVFLMIKIGPGYMGSLVYSHKVVVALSAR
jgi:hypothetical protein